MLSFRSCCHSLSPACTASTENDINRLFLHHVAARSCACSPSVPVIRTSVAATLLSWVQYVVRCTKVCDSWAQPADRCAVNVCSCSLAVACRATISSLLAATLLSGISIYVMPSSMRQLPAQLQQILLQHPHLQQQLLRQQFPAEHLLPPLSMVLTLTGSSYAATILAMPGNKQWYCVANVQQALKVTSMLYTLSGACNHRPVDHLLYIWGGLHTCPRCSRQMLPQTRIRFCYMLDAL